MIFFIAHITSKELEKYKKNSIDRKPNNGMIKKAIQKWNIDIKKVFVGDSLKDKLAAKSNLKFYKSTNNLNTLIKKIFKNINYSNIDKN